MPATCSFTCLGNKLYDVRIFVCFYILFVKEKKIGGWLLTHWTRKFDTFYFFWKNITFTVILLFSRFTCRRVKVEFVSWWTRMTDFILETFVPLENKLYYIAIYRNWNGLIWFHWFLLRGYWSFQFHKLN